jgi:ankyrin repeat protein
MFSPKKFAQPVSKFTQPSNKFTQPVSKFTQPVSKFTQPVSKFISQQSELFQAVENRDNEKVFELLQCETCFSEDELHKAFMRAINKNDATLVRYFLAFDRINFKTLNRSPISEGGVLYDAIGNANNTDMVSLLIATGKSEPGYHGPPSNRTPLMGATESCNIEMVKLLLLTKESNPGFVNENGESALSIAENNNCIEIIEILERELDL